MVGFFSLQLADESSFLLCERPVSADTLHEFNPFRRTVIKAPAVELRCSKFAPVPCAVLEPCFLMVRKAKDFTAKLTN
jgi:hypothetical protein